MIFYIIIILTMYFLVQNKYKTINWLLFFTLILLILITIISRAVNKWSYNDDKYTIYSKIINPFKLNSHEYNSKFEYNKDIKFPFIIKPIICSGSNKGVQLIKNKKELDEFNKNRCIYEKYMVQEFYPTKYEVGILYEKIPYISDGKIVSIVLKHKEGGNWSPLKCENQKNKGVNCSIRNDLITEDLSRAIKKIADKIPGFNMGRFDIGFNDIDEFKKGEKFKCFELNGVMGYDLRFSTKDFGIQEIGLIFRWIFVRILTGSINLLTANALYTDIIKSYYSSAINYQRCQDFEKIFESCTA